MKKNINIKVPPPLKTLGKGAPPKVVESSNNLVKSMEGDSVAFNFRVPAEFRKQVRQYALDNDTTAVKLMTSALEEYMNNKR